ncbi:low specificity L-threonine aldolase [Maritimibacter sp. 55A14]|uniref:threonine aldolase family protein n=1 Tax=Maritimibacter sp. 55A14 TaxID=2174844 RepID=UPI000D622E72|nr:beta-eliminating lyase-related protein [Maritimibacter sp. 55A14]PWE32137.1 low specificity L-threonine aldolase [Maritimibacter sp. 55A14]
MDFISDNTGPVPDAILASLRDANAGRAMPYGGDAPMERVTARLRALFEAPEAAVYLVGTGTAANALALATLCQPWQSIFCHRASHLEEDECGAPEFFSAGAKLALVDGASGKMTPETLEATILTNGIMGVHGTQRGPVALTQMTEMGTVYTPAEIAALTGLARAHGLPVYMDGARIANAIAALGCDPADITWKAGVDAVSFGGTKNGCLGVEAVIFFDPAQGWEFELRRKRAGHLFSKHRYLAAQMAAYLEGGLWRDLALRANAVAGRLARGLAALPDAELIAPAEGNMVFAAWPRAGHRRARDAGASYLMWPPSQRPDGPGGERLAARLVCDWSMDEARIDRFLDLLNG